MSPKAVTWVALLVDAAASAALWPRLPARVPLHWGLSGEPDRFGRPLELVVGGPALLLGVWGLLLLLPRLDPRVRAPLPPDAPPAEAGSRELVGAVVVSLLAVAHVGLVLVLAQEGSLGPPLLMVAACAFQVLLGNALPRVRPNFFVGIRTPWTLSSDTVWRRTHRVAGRLLVGSGLLSALLLAALPGPWRVPAVAGLFTAAALVPVGLSYLFWRAEVARAEQRG